MALTPLQERVLQVLAGIAPPWTLSGGGALVGFHLGHRTTRDLDLFWHGQSKLIDVTLEVRQRLRAAGLSLQGLRTSETFERLEVSDGSDTIKLDLVAEPVPNVESPKSHRIGPLTILVDTPHEILVNKLCALLSRSELRDLDDVRELLQRGGDLQRAMADAPRKDGGFSALMLSWVLRDWQIPRMAEAAGYAPAAARELAAFRDAFMQRLAHIAAPPG
jgi:hypothetical protein